MLRRTKRLLTSRSTVLVLILLLTAAMTAAVLVPQRGAPAPGDAGAGGVRSVVALLGLEHVFSTWWFAALAIAFVVSLVLSTFDQLQLARARTRQLPPEQGDGVACAIARGQVEEVLAREGYRRLALGPGRARWVKFWPGYWGTFLLHAGMTVSVVFSLVYVLTEHRIIVRAVSGRPVRVDSGLHPERRGLLAAELPLPATVTLSRVEPAFWPDDHVQDVVSRFVFTDGRGTSEEFRVGVNHPQDYRGLTVYQKTDFGNAFLVEFRGGPGGEFAMMLELPIPPGRAQAAYGTFPLKKEQLRIDAKYYANADRSRIAPENPNLVVRLMEGDRVVAEASLLDGQTDRLGPYEVRLAAVAWWTEILFEGSRGTWGIFSGFALLLLGGVLAFFAVPREVVLRESAAGCTIAWRTPRFADFYAEERARILSRCSKGEK